MKTETGDRGHRRPTQRTPKPPVSISETSIEICATCRHYATDIKPEYQDEDFPGHCLQLSSHNNIPMTAHAKSNEIYNKRKEAGQETTAHHISTAHDSEDKRLKAKMMYERTGWGVVLVKPNFGCRMWEKKEL